MNIDLDPDIPVGAHEAGSFPVGGGQGVCHVYRLGKHYYGSIRWVNGEKEQVTRRLSAVEISSDPRMWSGYEEGDEVSRFYTSEHLHEKAERITRTPRMRIDTANVSDPFGALSYAHLVAQGLRELDRMERLADETQRILRVAGDGAEASALLKAALVEFEKSAP